MLAKRWCNNNNCLWLRIGGRACATIYLLGPRKKQAGLKLGQIYDTATDKVT